jgi:hypothetical protein
VVSATRATIARLITTAAAIAANIAIAATAAIAMTSQRLAIAPDEGDADHREEHRDAEQQNTIHPKILQQTGTYLKLEHNFWPSRELFPLLTADKGEGPFCSYLCSPQDGRLCRSI